MSKKATFYKVSGFFLDNGADKWHGTQKEAKKDARKRGDEDGDRENFTISKYANVYLDKEDVLALLNGGGGLDYEDIDF